MSYILYKCCYSNHYAIVHESETYLIIFLNIIPKKCYRIHKEKMIPSGYDDETSPDIN